MPDLWVSMSKMEEKTENGLLPTGKGSSRPINVAELCIDKYRALSRRGKPQKGEWTVLAGVVMATKTGTVDLTVCRPHLTPQNKLFVIRRR